ncbi:MAG TPA: hypothetical protein VE997_05805 [Candidatus Limnocylindria bacterium]|jgi:hypothetical protein|nr:hypothetical protein [Candidatus Limnocylindria bacterium]
MMPLRGRAKGLLRREPVHAVAAAAALAAIAARLPGAVGYPLWQDEVASARILIEPTPWAAVARVVDTESTPPLWYVLAWLVHHAGVPVVATRGLSVLCGGALAALVVFYADRFLPLWAAGLAGLLAALGWQFVYHGRELRAYALFALLAVVFALLLEASVRAPTRARLAGLAVTSAAGALTHYFFLLTLGTGLLWLWTSRSAGAARGRVTAALGLSLLPFLAWLPGLIAQQGDARLAWITQFSGLKVAYLYSTVFASAGPLYVRDHPVDIGPAEAVGRFVLLAVVLAGAAVLARRSERARLCALLGTVPVAAGVVGWLAGAQIFTTRNFLGAAPFACIAVAAAVAALPRRAAFATAAVAVVLVAAGYAQERVLAPPPYDEAAAALVRDGWRRGDPVAIVGGAHRLFYLGNVHALQSPVQWYLPGHPELVSAAPRTTCARVYLLAPAGSGSLVADRAGVGRAARGEMLAGSLVVMRLPCTAGVAAAVPAAGGRWFESTG